MSLQCYCKLLCRAEKQRSGDARFQASRLKKQRKLHRQHYLPTLSQAGYIPDTDSTIGVSAGAALDNGRAHSTARVTLLYRIRTGGQYTPANDIVFHCRPGRTLPHQLNCGIERASSRHLSFHLSNSEARATRCAVATRFRHASPIDSREYQVRGRKLARAACVG